MIPLGASGLRVSRLGIGASYGVGARAIEAAFDRGINYLYWGSLRRETMGEAIRNIARRDRERLVVAIQSYARSALAMRWSLERGLRKLGFDHGDVLLLGWWRERPPDRILEEAVRLRERGRARALAISSHNRRAFRDLAALGVFDAVMVRYNAAHRGAEGEVFPHLPAGAPAVIAYTATRWGSLIDPAKTPPGERTPAGSDCYRFALAHPRVSLVLAGPADQAELEEALRAIERGPMSEEELGWMRRVGDHVYRNTRAGIFTDRERPGAAAVTE
jgi:aryl-alcohol dehydrogenase-like predicted oxidoreductase